ncbi:substrate-binding periplasmic protein [Thiocystis violacea]|uniref:substrate-binding periplasmic protein n=1 Tax=Thiocystis violacea TaxID=13725 RepID=UPI001905105A|nr:transporter substrate-binding domain-containing protein [Thiocystis violacea]
MLLSICWLGLGFAEDRIRLTNGEWPPYFSSHLKHYGVGSRIVSEAFAMEGVRVEYGFFPWKRSLKLAEEGTWDGAVGWDKNPERERKFHVSLPVWEAPWVFFHLKSLSFDWIDFDDLRDLRIGGTLGYMYSRGFFEAESSGRIKVERTTSDELNFKKLRGGRIDVFPQLMDIGYFQLHELYDPETVDLFTHHDIPIGKHCDYLLLSRHGERNTEMMERFNRGLKKLRQSGKYEQYFDESRRGEYGD